MPFIFIYKPDIVIISVPKGEQIFGAYLGAKISGAKIIFDIRDPWEDNMLDFIKSISKTLAKLAKRVIDGLYIKSDLIVTVTPKLAVQLQRRGRSNIKIIYNGADTRIFKSYNKVTNRAKFGFSNDKFIMVYSGSLGRYYRLDIVIKAISKLNYKIRRKLIFLIVGFGPEINKLMNLAKKLRVEDNVLYLGEINDKLKLAKILSIADVGVIPPSDTRIFNAILPVKFFECCACGLPVLATVHENSLLAYIIKRFNIGLISPPLDYIKLAENISKIFYNHNFRKNAKKRARILIEKLFNRNKQAERYAILIEKMVN